MGAHGWGRALLERLAGQPVQGARVGDRAGGWPDRDMPDFGGIGGLLQAVGVALCIADADGRLTFFNDAAATLWGWRPPLRETRWCGGFRLYRDGGTLLPHAAAPLAVALQQDRPVRGMEAVLERPDGTLVPFIAHATPLHDVAGRLVGAVCVLIDISARKTAEAAAREAAMAKTRFLAAMNHEFRTPIHGILGFSGLLAQASAQDGACCPEQSGWVREIQAAGSHLLGLVHDSLAFAEAPLAETRPVTGRARLRLGALVADVLSLAAPAFSVRGLTVRSEGPLGEPVAAMDAPAARQALLGVVKEAARHMPEGGTMGFAWGDGAGTGGPFVALRCPGLALPPEFLCQLDRPFAATGRGLAGGLDGAGLSVATSAALMRAHGGSLTIAGGTAGAPATFRLTFARAGSALEAAVITPAQAAAIAAVARRDLLAQPAPRPSFSLTEVVAAARDVIVVTAADLDSPGPAIVYVNPAFVALTGYAAEEVIGRTPRMLHGPRTDHALLRRMSDALRAGHEARGTVVNYGRDGGAYWLDMHIVPLRDGMGCVTHYASIERLVTDHPAQADA